MPMRKWDALNRTYRTDFMDDRRRAVQHSRFPVGQALLVVLIVAASAGRTCAQLTLGDSNVGYIDSSVLATQFRVRFDAGYNSRSADRVEFIYAKYGQPGAPLVESGIDSYQELAAYLELQPLENLSLFVDVPIRWVNPVVNDNTGGMYDINAGAKLSLWQSRDTQFTAQLRTYIPTGDADRGLSTGHPSLEPALLGLCRLTDRLTVEAELRDWIPIDASTTGPGGGDGSGGGSGSGAGQGRQRDFSSHVLRYGVGVGYRAAETAHFSVTPATELVGWHVFSGLKSTSDGDRVSALNDHILNLKLGLRLGRKNCVHELQSPSTLFVGYGCVLSQDNWYNEIMRFEFRQAF